MSKQEHDETIAGLTAPAPPKQDELPELPKGPEGTESVELPPPPPPVPIEEQNQGEAVAPDSSEPIISRHGEIFDRHIHAMDGDKPKIDSTGKFILKEHDYRGPRPSSQFPD